MLATLIVLYVLSVLVCFFFVFPWFVWDLYGGDEHEGLMIFILSVLWPLIVVWLFVGIIVEWISKVVHKIRYRRYK